MKVMTAPTQVESTTAKSINKTQTKTRISFKNILVATDFSSGSEQALGYATELARRYGSKVFALHVIPPDSYRFGPLETLDLRYTEVRQWAEEHLQKVAKKLAKVPHKTFLREGEVWEAINEIMPVEEIDLIVLGTRGRTGIKKFFLGSVAEQIYRRATCPVLTVGPHAAPWATPYFQFREIIFATNFSPASMAAAPYAFSIAQENQARLTLLHVLDDQREPYLANGNQMATDAVSRLRAMVLEDVALWCEPKYVVLTGPVRERIIEAAAERKADLIVMGAHPTEHVGAATHLPASTAHKVVAEAFCPVLTVRG